MQSYLLKAGLSVLACSLFANQVTVMAQDNGIDPVNTVHQTTSTVDNGIDPVNTIHYTSSSQISVSISIVTSTSPPTTVVVGATSLVQSVTTVTGADHTVTATTSIAPIVVTAPGTTVITSSAVTVTAPGTTVITQSAVTVTGPGTTVTAPPGGMTQAFSLPDQQAVITQAPCVKGCLQAAVIAPAVGACGRSAGIAINNGCGCLSAPLNALQALTICVAAACPIQGAAGTMDPSSGSVIIASLYNAYCMTAVDPALYSQATAGGLSSWTDTSSATTNIIPVTVIVGTPVPGEVSGNSTFTGNIQTVTSTDIITASVATSAGTTPASGDSTGNNAGVQNGVRRVAMGGVTMTIFATGLAVILIELMQ